uniref:UPF0489 protein C5orf22 homolog n=1 Tax=Phallusia mammillata TaxID=59560 RepID=A0A6F9D7J3_9ASCI|nr:UPF0489 protein C5orf22 homolog [Phallusia mammillata]
MSRLKKYNEMPIHVVEYHNEALEHIYRAIGSKYLPFEHLVLVHFDAHPDLGIPDDIIAPSVFDKYELFAKVSIESWIMPAVYAGHINTIIWLKPRWAKQFRDGVYQFSIGKDPTSEKLRVSLKNLYFLSDCVYQDRSELTDTKEVKLQIITLEKDSQSIESITQLLEPGQHYILDVDLDCFSTLNPFKNMFSPEDLASLTKLYWYNPPKSIPEILSCQETRRNRLRILKNWLTEIANGNLEYSTDRKFKELARIVKNYETSIKKKFDEQEIEIIHGAGCSSGEPPLPHHISSDERINSLVAEFNRLLSTTQHAPTLCTIARSTIDDYCPSWQVEEIQLKILATIQEIYKPAKIFCHYKSTEVVGDNKGCL